MLQTKISKSALVFFIVLALCSSTSAKNLVCYYSNTAYNYTVASDDTPYYPSKIDVTLCTHYVYAYAVIDKTSFEITSSDPANDVTNGGYRNFTALRANNTQAKFLLAIGGKKDSNDASGKYSNLVNNPANINAMVNSTLAFLIKYQFDGVSFDWLFPSSTKDFAGYSNLIIALKTALQPNGLLLSSSVSPFQMDIDGYNVSVLNNYLDLVYLTTFGYHNPDSEPYYARHPSPLFNPPNDPSAANLTVHFSVSYWIAKGLSPWLINMGIPLHGYAWIMNATVQSPYLAPVDANGPLTADYSSMQIAGTFPYFDLCSLIPTNRWDPYEEPHRNISTYFLNSNENNGNLLWGGYDSRLMVIMKVYYAVRNHLGGVMLFDITQDDVKNNCGAGFNPITTIVSTMLSSYFDITNQLSKTTTTAATPSGTFPVTLPTTTPTRPVKCNSSYTFLPDPGSCKHFNILLDGVAYTSSCSIGKYFNATSLKCDEDPINLNCPTTGSKKSEGLSYSAIKFDRKVNY